MKINVQFDRSSGLKLTATILDAAAKRVSVEQLRQVNQAFVSGGQPNRKWPALKPVTGRRGNRTHQSYRNGGQPLRNTGHLKQSFTTKILKRGSLNIECLVVSPLPYALYQQNGLTTHGPNFIPLNRKAARTHVNGANPRTEGLIQGKDYIMAWKGVTVVARPIVDYGDSTNIKKLKQAVVKE
jgi:phage gpG-like protein